MKAQASVDFLMSYGIAIIIIVIAVAVIYKVGVLNPTAAPVSCTPEPGFSCSLFSINTTGAMSIYLAQATGGPITVKGIACSASQNATGSLPAYGNIYVTSNPAYYPYNAYPNNALSNGIVVYSGSGNMFETNCYEAGGVATGALGDAFYGFIWLNYTIPGYGNTVQKVASFTVKYT
ncbi:MAG: hypothetical protein ACP5RF_01545 [Candidatus Micrarchaeia archaeon]